MQTIRFHVTQGLAGAMLLGAAWSATALEAAPQVAMAQPPLRTSVVSARPETIPATSTSQWGQVRVANVNVRWGPGPQHGIVSVLRGGDFVHILAQEGTWYRIEWPSSTPAWVASDFVQPDGRITGNRVRVRAGGTPAAPILAELNRNDRVEIVGTVGNWYKIAPPADAQAYIFAKLVIAGVTPPAADIEPDRSPLRTATPAEAAAPTEPAESEAPERDVSQPTALPTSPVVEQPIAEPIVEAISEPSTASTQEPIAPAPEANPTESAQPAPAPVASAPMEATTSTTTPPNQIESAPPTPTQENLSNRPAIGTASSTPAAETPASPEHLVSTPEMDPVATAAEHAMATEPATPVSAPETTAPTHPNSAPQITFVQAGPIDPAVADTAIESAPPQEPPEPAATPPVMDQDLEDEEPGRLVHTPDHAQAAPEPTARQAMDQMLQDFPSVSLVRPSDEDARILVVPVEVRAAADQDDMGTLLPPPRFIRLRSDDIEVKQASPAPGLLSTPTGLRASAPLIFHLPPPSNGPGEYLFLNGRLQAAPEAGAGHLLQLGQNAIPVRSMDQDLRLDAFVGRHVEILARCTTNPRELQVTAIHPLD